MHRQQNNFGDRPPRQAPAPGPSQPIPPPRKESGGGGRRPPQRGDRRSGPNGHIFSALIRVLATLVICILLAIFILSSASDLFGLNQVDQEYQVEISAEATVNEISNILKEEGVISQKLTFRLYTGYKTKDVPLNGGEYTFNSNMAYDQIISLLKQGDQQDRTVKITFKEGETIFDYAKKLDEAEVCDGDEFLEYLQTGTNFENYRFFRELTEEEALDDEYLYMRMEGYLFPDTYDFYRGEKVSSVAHKFLSNFDNHFTDEWIRTIKQMRPPMTLDKTMTLASIIQKEANNYPEMQQVSSVFHNRLDNPSAFPHLQSDVTVFYVNNNMKDVNRPYAIEENQDLYDAYNTYQGPGLPPGPVCNPGMEAIRAAIYPTESGYYYFVTDANEEYYYSTNLQEHNANVAMAKEQDESGKGQVGGVSTQVTEDAQR